MKRYNFLILCVILGSLSAKAADQEKFCGTVINGDTSAPVAGAIVKAGDAFVFTDKEGYFSISPKVTADSISFRCLGFEPLTLPISSDFSNVSLYHKVTQLKDVIVEAPDIYARGDTLIFNVARYANAQDNAIIDVIKRLPGIKVKEDGTIEYQGKPINKFYLDGNDFIGGQYGLATNNISHKDVKAVEIMENHQPIKALEGIEFPEEAGINLKLKEDAQNRWVGVAKAGVGIQPLLYSGSLFAMRMAPNIQNMFTLKADNTGWNPANEIKDHDFDTMFSQDYSSALWPEFISADIITSPLSDKRTRDNLSFLANTITAWKRGDTSMRIKMDYIGERLDYNSGVTTDYFSSQIPVFIQNDTQRTRRHDVSAHFYSITNRSGYYLKDKLSVSSVRNKSNSDIVGSFNLTQHIDKKIFSAANDLKLVKRNEKRLFILSSRCSFEHHPDRMMISGEEDAFQSISTTDFRCTTETSLGKLTRFWKFYLTAGLDINYHRQENTLSGIEEFENNIVYKAFLSNLYALPQIDFDRNGWRISLNMPLKWLNYSAGATYNYVNVSPQLKVRRRLTAKSELSGVINYSLGSPQPYLNIASPVLTDYRNIFIAVNSNKYSQDCAASISYRCRNPLKSLFLNLSVAYSYHRCSVITNQLFVEDFIIST
ncbi:MAG: carboxypeptidase-like regulatory domain-containing protein, partial [Muribaculaceae bacterium]|nr:carboxypeptidase-like regulatory domain-containing protein [Muribaculaceae bacterium]